MLTLATRITGTAMARPATTGAGAQPGDAAPAPVAFTMPLPPSTNKLFRNVPGRGRVKTAEYLDFTQIGVVAIRNQRVPAVPGRVVVVYGFERLGRNAFDADVTNRVKAIEDTIVKAGVIEDDSLVVATALSWLPRANGLAHVQIYPVAEMAVRFHPSPDGACGAWIVQAPQPGEDDGYQPL